MTVVGDQDALFTHREDDRLGSHLVKHLDVLLGFVLAAEDAAGVVKRRLGYVDVAVHLLKDAARLFVVRPDPGAVVRVERDDLAPFAGQLKHLADGRTARLAREGEGRGVHHPRSLYRFLRDFFWPEQVVSAAGDLEVGPAARGGDEGHGGAVAVVHYEVLDRDPVALELALDELGEGPDAGLGDHSRTPAQLRDVDSYVGRRTPQKAPEGRRVAQPVRLLHRDEVNQRLAHGEEIQRSLGRR